MSKKSPESSKKNTESTKKSSELSKKSRSAAKSPRSRSPYIFALIAALFVGLLIYIFNFTNVRDYLTASRYELSPEISTLADKLQLTTEADLIFRASQPALHAQDFSQFCATSDPDRSILGCYHERRIHVYDINSAELSGIVESTTAHELLHAIWDRLSGREKDQLMNDLNDVYQAHYDELQIISEYPSASQATELYARVGTEIKNLPANLEAHFEKYFKNRHQIVDFYQSYAGTFSELSSALRLILTEIESLEPQIEEQKTTYKARSESFARAVNEFNSCAAKTGCFDTTTFESHRSKLLSEQAAINQIYDNLTANIARYNELVGEYNPNLLRERELVQIVNPNYEGEKINE